MKVELSFTTKRSAQETLDDLSIIDLWRKGNTLIYSRLIGNDMIPALQMPCIEDAPVIEMMANYVDKNREIYGQILRLENYLKTEFSLPKDLTYADKYAIEKVLSVFEPVEVEDTIWNLNLQINCNRQLYESLKIPSNHPMKMIEGIEENIYLFGHEYFIKEQQITIPCPVIENTDEVKNMLLSGNKAIAKIVSSTGKFTLQCKM